jgi:sugar phosphate isomerase/epimerase
MAEFGTTPIATDMFLDRKRYKNRLLTLDEGIASLQLDIDIAVKLGASIIRVIINTPPEVVEGCASYAMDHGVQLAVEVHSPMRFDHRWVVQHLEVIHRIDNGYVGLLADMSTFVARLPRIVTAKALRDGATPELVKHIAAVYELQPHDLHTLAAEIAWAGGTPADMGLVAAATWYSSLPPEVLTEHIPHLFHIQAKFYEMTDELVEYSIPYDRLIQVLVEGGYKGYLSSEYEGTQYIQDVEEVDSIEQVRRQHLMFERLLRQRGM